MNKNFNNKFYFHFQLFLQDGNDGGVIDLTEYWNIEPSNVFTREVPSSGDIFTNICKVTIKPIYIYYY